VKHYWIMLVLLLIPGCAGSAAVTRRTADAATAPGPTVYQAQVPGIPIGDGLRIGGVWRRTDPADAPSQDTLVRKTVTVYLVWASCAFLAVAVGGLVLTYFRWPGGPSIAMAGAAFWALFLMLAWWLQWIVWILTAVVIGFAAWAILAGRGKALAQRGLSEVVSGFELVKRAPAEQWNTSLRQKVAGLQSDWTAAQVRRIKRQMRRRQ